MHYVIQTVVEGGQKGTRGGEELCRHAPSVSLGPDVLSAQGFDLIEYFVLHWAACWLGFVAAVAPH